MTVEEAIELGKREQLAGNLRAAEEIYRKVLATQPNHVEALRMLGAIAYDVGKHDVAADLFARVIRIDPNKADHYVEYGASLNLLGRDEQAIAAYRTALAIDPNCVTAMCNLGDALRIRWQPDEAIEVLQRALKLRPDYFEAMANLGNALGEKRRFEEAIEWYRKAIEIQPNHADLHSNLSYALGACGKFDEAIIEGERALAIKPGRPGRLNLANVLREVGQLERSMEQHRMILESNPDDAAVHYNISLTLLLQGRFADGWKEHEWRFKAKEYQMPRRKFPQPRWNGEELNGRRIFVYAEQGLGDTIQFARYLPMLADRGGQVISECHPELVRLLSGIHGVQIIRRGEPLPQFDLHSPLLSLPMAFGTDLGNIPDNVPYLSAEPEIIEKFAAKIPSDGRKKIGLAWAGSPQHIRDRLRSVTLASLAPLAAAGDFQFFNLQTGDAAKQAKNPPDGMNLIDWSDDLKDLADTAALIANLDLVITVDTSIAHLAGALGKPVWLLLTWLPDWRWMLDRPDSPWYPTMRLFRQSRLCEWQDAIDRVAMALRAEPPP
jgi:tetratricopeptide (TPR) repeat protein